MTTKTTTEEAAALRAAYKHAGWNSRMISVRAHHYSLGSAIRITIKDARVDLRKARAMAEGSERIRRDEMTGEILGGGNRYVTVRLSKGLKTILARRHLDAVADACALAAKDETGRMLYLVAGTDFLMGRDNHAFMLYHDGRKVRWFSNPEEGALGIATHGLNIE